MDLNSAGIVVVGDEILSGRTVDCNSSTIARAVRQAGVCVKRIVVVPDDTTVIADVVRDFSRHFHHVFVSGGLGPTHDDVTMSAVASAFHDLLTHSDQLQALFASNGILQNNAAALSKITQIPSTAKLLRLPSLHFPIVSVSNVFVLPGIPKVVTLMMAHLSLWLKQLSSVRFALREVLLSVSETDILDILNETQKKHSEIALGSYPEETNGKQSVRLTFESVDKLKADSAFHDFIEKTELEWIDSVQLHENLSVCEFLMSEKESESDEALGRKVKAALGVICEAVRRYGFDGCSVSFNGGKDCTVLLHLIAVALELTSAEKLQLGVYETSASESVELSSTAEKSDERTTPIDRGTSVAMTRRRLHAIYVVGESPFEEVETFVSVSEKRYGLKLVRVSGSVREGLKTLKEMPNVDIQAIFVGSRATDPHCGHLRTFSPTDGDWPSFMRVNPILDWSYAEIWSYLLRFEVPYCSLYENGYTSLGTKTNTAKNPELLQRDGSYAHAALLDDETHERGGRLVRKL